MRLRRGTLVVLEGLDGTGKTTQSRNLGSRLRRLNRIHMPSGHSPATAAVYEALEKHRLQSAFGAQLLHLACHCENLETIRELREEGLLLERWWWSTWAYGLGPGNLTGAQTRELRSMIECVWGDVRADVVYLFLDPLKRSDGTLAGVEQAYRGLAKQFFERTVILKPGPIESVTQTILDDLVHRGLTAS